MGPREDDDPVGQGRLSGARAGVPPRLGARRRLLARLDEHDLVTVVRAPAGFGKRTLLQTWAETRDGAGTSTVWVEPAAGRRSPRGFWDEVVAALEPFPEARPRPSSLVAVRALVAARGVPLTLVCPRIDRVATPELVGRLLDLVQSVRGLSLVASVRDDLSLGDPASDEPDPGDGVALLLAHADVVDGAELVLGEDEVDEVCRAASLQRSPEQVAVLRRVTGGWPALLHAAVLAVAEGSVRADEAELAQRAARAHLAAEVLPGITDRAGATLAELAVPRRLTAAGAAVVLGTGETRAAAMLARLVRAGVLTARSEDGDRVHAWPDALAAALRDRLAEDGPDRLHDLDVRLARWHLDRGEPLTALLHAAAADAAPLVGEVLDRYWLPLIVYDNEVLAPILRSAPAHWYDGRRFLHGVRDLALRLPRDPTMDVIRLPDDPAELERQAARPDVRSVLNAGMVELFGLRRAHRLDEALALAERLRDMALAARVASPGAVNDLLAPLFLLTAIIHELCGDFSGAVAQHRWSYLTAGDSVLLGSARHSSSQLAMDLALLGDVDEAVGWVERAAQTPVVEGWVAPRARIATLVADALVATSRLDQAAARSALRDLMSLTDPLDELWAMATYARAEYALLWGDRLAVVQHILGERDARPPSLAASRSAVERLTRAAEVDLLLALGQRPRAHAALRAAPDLTDPLLAVARARLPLLAGRPEVAVDQVHQALVSIPASTRVREDLTFIEIVAEHRLGRTDRAADLLERALDELPAPSLRAFAMAPRADLAAIGARVPAAASYLEAVERAGVADVFPSSAGPTRLTPRELVILRHLAIGLSRDEIARRLSVSSHTVKSQAHSIYRKLGVRSRSQAVAVAREQGLLGRPEDGEQLG